MPNKNPDKNKLVVGEQGKILHAPDEHHEDNAKFMEKFEERLNEPRVGPEGFQRGLSDKKAEKIRAGKEPKKDKDA